MSIKVTAILNQKGGVGKTTSAINLAAALGESGKRVLLIDLDPQANATSGLGLTPEEGKSFYPALIGERNASELIQATAYANVSIIPSEIDLAGCEIELARMENPLMKVRDTLQSVRSSDNYDIILIDCPPSLGVLMTNALAAADGLLIPVQCEFYALEGIQKLLDLLTRMRVPEINPTLQIVGIFMTMYDARTRLSQQVVADVKQHLPDHIFETIIPRSIRLGEAPSHGQPITVYDSMGVGATAYRDLAKEFLKRIQG
jgi:chromosome partitioning protein